MEYTKNYQLPLWAEDDRILRTDFNGMTANIENALAHLQTAADTNASGIATVNAAVATRGNCQTYLASYVGTGNVPGTQPVSFPNKPFLVILFDTYRNECYPLPYGAQQTHGSRETPLSGVSWSGNTLNLPTSSLQTGANEPGKVYQLFALLEL